MITPKNRDMNRSRDVKGPELKRPYDQESSMGDKMMGDLFHDSHPTGTLEKHSLSDLHQGNEHSPLKALGQQEVVVSSDMGKEHPDHKPSLSKGGMREPKGLGRSVAKKMMSEAKKKSGY